MSGGIQWREGGLRGALLGYSGDVTVASVVQRSTSGRWYWGIEVSTRGYGFRNHGERATRTAAKGAAEQAWRRWLFLAALAPVEEVEA